MKLIDYLTESVEQNVSQMTNFPKELIETMLKPTVVAPILEEFVSDLKFDKTGLGTDYRFTFKGDKFLILTYSSFTFSEPRMVILNKDAQIRLDSDERVQIRKYII